MSKKLIRLTESDLHRVIKESVNNILTEVTHGFVQKGFNGNVNKKKTPYQILAQKNRITKSFNQIYGSNEPGNEIEYDFEPNDLNYVQKGDVKRQNPHSNYFFRNEISNTGNGGVTMTGKDGKKMRFTPVNNITRGLNAAEAGGVSDNKFDWYGSVDKHDHGVMDSNKQLVNTKNFNNQQIDALNNVNDTYNITTNMWGEKKVSRGGKPFIYNKK